MKNFITRIGDYAGPQIEAFDSGHAKQIAAEMDLDLIVIGEHILTISREGFTEADADRMCKALSEEY